MKHMTTAELIEKVVHERNLSKKTESLYKLSIKQFEEHIGMTIVEMVDIAKQEEKSKIIWSESQLRSVLLSFRAELYKKIKKGSAHTYFTKITAVFRHFGLNIGYLPPISTKQTKIGTPIYPEDVPDREMIDKCIRSSTTIVLKPLVLCLSSTGLSAIDVARLTVRDYLESTKEYHNHPNDIILAIKEMENSNVSIVPTFKSSRRKTGINYVTFGSPEFVAATNSYLLTRENLQLDDQLFKITRSYINVIFQEVNRNLGLGTVNDTVGRFSPKMMRIYQATQLHAAGIPSDIIDIIQGRTPKSLIYKSYIRIKTSDLKEAYIKALPYIVIDDSSKIKTKLQVVEEENRKYKEIVENIDERIERKIAESMKKNISDEEFLELFS